jgi:nitronate monooxygenase
VGIPFPRLDHPIVQAPLAGGPSTPELTAAVSAAGGLGFLASGYKTPAAVRADIGRVRELTGAPFGVNLFCLSRTAVDEDALARYARRLEAEATRYGVELGEARFEDDRFNEKLALILSEGVQIASFTFGCPAKAIVEQLHESGCAVWVTVTEAKEAVSANAAGADALVVQGVEAGGHRASFTDVDGCGEIALLPLLRLVERAVDLPLVASGGIADGPGIAAVLSAGASAAQIGTGFMLCPEAGTSQAHREALARGRATALTRAFTGRRARGIVNRFLTEHGPCAPAAYPHVHHLTAPVRAAAREAGDSEAINLWAGEALPLAEELPAGELVHRWSSDARAALAQARSAWAATDPGSSSSAVDRMSGPARTS